MIDVFLPGEARHPNRWPYRMSICGAVELRQGSLSWEATHVVSIDRREDRFGMLLDSSRHLLLAFDDVTDIAHAGAPGPAHLEALMSFVDGLPGDAALVIHCAHGVSRSTALTLGLLAREVAPLRAAALLHALCPFACPNPLLVRLWDDHLALRGKLVEVSDHFPTVFWRHGDGAGTSRSYDGG